LFAELFFTQKRGLNKFSYKTEEVNSSKSTDLVYPISKQFYSKEKKMRTQIWKGFSLFMVFALILGVNVAIASPNASGPTPTNHIQLDHKRPVLEDSAELSGVLPQSIINKLNNKTGKVDIVVELRDRPSVMVYSDAKVTLNEQDANLEAVNQLQNIQKAQDSFITLMNKNNIAPQILFRTQRVLNGIYMKVDASKVKEIAKLKGVKAIYPLVPKQLDNNY